jgi:hypothetical protein
MPVFGLREWEIGESVWNSMRAGQNLDYYTYVESIQPDETVTPVGIYPSPD